MAAHSSTDTIKITDGTDQALVSATGRLLVDATGVGTGTQFAEDAIHVSGDLGTMALGVRNDLGTALAADGDYMPLTFNASGALYVTGGGGGTEYTEDAVAAANPVGGAQILVRQDTPAALVTLDGDNVARRGTNYGAAYSQIITSAGAFVDTFGGGTQYTEGDVDATITGTAAMMEVAANTLQPVQGTVADGLLVNLGTNNDVTVTSGTITNLSQLNGVAISLNTGVRDAGTQRVTIATNDAVPVTDNAGSLTVDQPTASNLNAEVQGDVAHDAVGTGVNPLLVGGYASAAAPTNVSLDGDAVRTWHLLNGAQATVVTAAGALIGGDAANGLDVDVTRLPALVAGTANIGDVDVLTVPAPLSTTGGGTEAAALRVTIANDSTGLVSVDDNGSSLTVDGTVTANAGTGNFNVIGTKTNDNAAPGATNVGVLAGIANAAAPTWTEGNLVGLSVNTAGALRVTGGGGGTEYVVDAAAPAAPTGTTLVSERDDQLATLTEIEGDWTNSRATSKGALWVAIPDVNGDPITSFGGGTQYTEDAAAAANPTGTAPILVRKDTPATVTDVDGDNVAQRGTNYGAAYCQIVTSAGAYVDTFGGGTQYTEGDVDATITGTAAMMEVAGNTLQPVQGTVADGLLVNLGANNDVTVTGSVTANAGTNLNTSALNLETTQSSVLTSVQLIDDSVATLGTTTYTEAATKGLIIGALRRDADTTAVDTTNEIGPLQMDANGRLKVEVFSGETLPISGTVTATATDLDIRNLVQATDSVSIGDGTNLVGVLADGADNVANTTNQLVTAAVLYAYDGTAFDRVTIGNGLAAAALRVTLASDSTGTVIATQATGSNLHTVVDSGTITTVSTVSALGVGTTGPQKAEDVAHATGDMGIACLGTANEANTARAADNDYIPIALDTEGNVRMVGNRDHDAVDAGEVVATGGQAIAHGANPTAVAAADRTRWYFNRAGIPFVMAGHPNIVTIRANATASQTDVALVTVGAGAKIVVTRCSVMADKANTVDVAARIGFGTVNTPTTTGVILSHPGIAAGSGVVEGNGSGILGVGADNEDLRITSEVPTTGSIDVLVSYYTIES